MTMRLQSISIAGFKTITRLDAHEPGALGVLIGANGAGKSNFISFFRMLGWMLASPGTLQEFVGREGGADKLLHGGAATTRDIEAHLVLDTDAGRNEYHFRLAFAAGDTFIFTEERYRYSAARFGSSDSIGSIESGPPWIQLGAGHREARLIERADSGDKTAATILSLLRGCVVYQFHNTSPTARMHTKWYANDNLWLKEDGGNLAPMLLRLRDHEPRHYRRIVENIRQIIPFFADFALEPEHDQLLLRWRERKSDMLFSSSQASDGMLRTLALVTLLLLPTSELPHLMLLDEPELGLHPAAIQLVCGLIHATSSQCQVMLATQSPTLLDHFDPEHIIVVDRHDNASSFRRLQTAELKDWLDEYSMAELWEKNVIGGRPST